MKKYPISVLIASCDEGYLLEDCLKSLQFCDEIVGVNLESSDNTKALMQQYCTRYEEHKRVPIVELIHPIYIPQLKHDWIMVIDPDERLTPALKDDIVNTIFELPDTIAAVRVPMFNHFKGKKLEHSVYGGLIYFRLLYRKSGIILSEIIHNSIQLKEGFDRIKIPYKGNNIDIHLWCQSWKKLFEKHNRYLKSEGNRMYKEGYKYSYTKQIKSSILKFYYSYKGCKGYKMGLTGLLLSLFAFWFEFSKWNKLKKTSKLFS